MITSRQMHLNVFFFSPCKPMTVKIKNSTIESSKSEKLLGKNMDSNFSFNNHITDLCREMSQNSHALPRIVGYMTFDKNNKHF